MRECNSGGILGVFSGIVMLLVSLVNFVLRGLFDRAQLLLMMGIEALKCLASVFFLWSQ